MAITVYKIDASPPARAVMMIADLLKLNYKTIDVNILAGDNFKPEYLQKNPMHSVPLLEDGDFTLADSHSIITYLVSKYGAEKRAELYPSDLRTRAIIDQRLFFDTSFLFPKLQALVRAILYEKVSEFTDKQVADVNEAYGVVEKYLQRTGFIATDHLTVADISCVASISSLDCLIPVDSKYEKLHEWWNNLKEQEWYQRMNVPGLTAFGGYMKQAIEKNVTSE